MTPASAVCAVLDAAGYGGAGICGKKIMEPSFGDGAFLTEIIKRAAAAARAAGKTPEETADILKNSICGIEKDAALYGAALKRIGDLTVSLGLGIIDWGNSLLCGDTLSLYGRFAGREDFVCGNPPYVEPKNMDAGTLDFIRRNFRFCGGKTDLYIAFYEAGLAMLGDGGKLAFISANSFMRNTSQTEFRKYLVREKCILSLRSFCAEKIFGDADTYTCICVLGRNAAEKGAGIAYTGQTADGKTVSVTVPQEKAAERLGAGQPWNFSPDSADGLAGINPASGTALGSTAAVRTGIATNCDAVYIHRVFLGDGTPYTGKHTDPEKTVWLDAGEDRGIPIESTLLRRCVKASVYAGGVPDRYIIFPYVPAAEECGRYTVIPEETMESRFPLAAAYFASQRAVLSHRKTDGAGEQYRFGRSQGFSCFGRKKIVFRHVIPRDCASVKPYVLDSDVAVYSGFFSFPSDVCDPDSPEYAAALEKLAGIYRTPEFARCMAVSGKDMCGGYAAFSGKDVKNYRF